METSVAIDERVYSLNAERKLSVRDLLTYFSQQGRMRVSDLHLKVGSPPVYRMDGRLTSLKGDPIDAPTMDKLIAALITPMEIAEFKRSQSVDASFVVGDMQFRINVFYENDGPSVALRALENEPMAVEQIGFPNAVWEDIINKQQGLVILTGITGAGKSTTVASLIDRIAKTQPCRIITLEDPIEYRLHSRMSLVSQREVGRHVPSFERGLRDCLREDPDVIFVGEMRDRESTRWTLTAAETGHLVFSTLHTRDVRGTLTRILDMFPEGQHEEVANQISLGLSHIISQKLVPRADGQGRVVAMEILNNTLATANLIRHMKVEQIYSQLQTKVRDFPNERMITMEACLAKLVAEGMVTEEEASKWANHPLDFESAMRSAR